MTLQTQQIVNSPAPLLPTSSAGELPMPSRTLSPRTPAGTMPASTVSSVHGVNAKSSQRFRLSQR